MDSFFFTTSTKLKLMVYSILCLYFAKLESERINNYYRHKELTIIIPVPYLHNK